MFRDGGYAGKSLSVLWLTYEDVVRHMCSEMVLEFKALVKLL